MNDEQRLAIMRDLATHITTKLTREHMEEICFCAVVNELANEDADGLEELLRRHLNRNLEDYP